jgi:hypothetical protein
VREGAGWPAPERCAVREGAGLPAPERCAVREGAGLPAPERCLLAMGRSSTLAAQIMPAVDAPMRPARGF